MRGFKKKPSSHFQYATLFSPIKHSDKQDITDDNMNTEMLNQTVKFSLCCLYVL